MTNAPVISQILGQDGSHQQSWFSGTMRDDAKGATVWLRAKQPELQCAWLDQGSKDHMGNDSSEI